MGRVPGNAGEDVGQPCLRIDIVHLGRLCRTPNYAEPTFASRGRHDVESHRLGIVSSGQRAFKNASSVSSGWKRLAASPS